MINLNNKQKVSSPISDEISYVTLLHH